MLRVGPQATKVKFGFDSQVNTPRTPGRKTDSNQQISQENLRLSNPLPDEGQEYSMKGTGLIFSADEALHVIISSISLFLEIDCIQ